VSAFLVYFVAVIAGAIFLIYRAQGQKQRQRRIHIEQEVNEAEFTNENPVYERPSVIFRESPLYDGPGGSRLHEAIGNEPSN
jgi:hypothetical protein